MELGWNYSQKGMQERAAAACDSAIANAPQADPIAPEGCGWVYGRAGRRQQVFELLRRMTATSSRRWVEPFDVAILYVGLGDPDRAIEWLRKAARERSQGLVFLKVEPQLDPLRSDPRFKALLRELRIAS